MKKVFILLLSSLFALSLSAACISGNCQNGQGTFKFKDGSVYEGFFKNNKFQGQGTMKYSNGNVYIGKWLNHERSGRGKLTFPNGDKYVGHFQENKFWGKGKFTYSTGDFFDGDWVNHLAHGKGVYRFEDNERYEGEFFKGEFSGVGAFYYNDGTVFIGNWKNNKKNGEGKMHFGDGQKTHGTWVDDELIDRDVRASHTTEESVPVENVAQEDVLTTQRYWKDCTNAYCNSEIGQLIYGDGSKWQGQFVSGQPDGTGTMFYADGNRYEGELRNHAPNGEGVMYFASGNVIGATWNDGYPTRRKQEYAIEAIKQKVKVDKNDEIKIWAVIVGVSAYAHMPALRYTDDDAYQMYAFLKSPEGGALPNSQIQLLIDEDATRENILTGMNEVLLKADENDVVLMYYSGHGLPGMFLPIDFDGYRNSLTHKEVLDIFDSSKAKHKLCIADACHSGSLLASRSPFQNQLDGFYQQYESTKGGTALIMSSKSEEVSLETSGLRQGIFSHYLIRGLNGEADTDKNNIVTVSELFKFVDYGVKKYSGNKQRPSIAGNYDEDMPVSTVRK